MTVKSHLSVVTHNGNYLAIVPKADALDPFFCFLFLSYIFQILFFCFARDIVFKAGHIYSADI